MARARVNLSSTYFCVHKVDEESLVQRSATVVDLVRRSVTVVDLVRRSATVVDLVRRSATVVDMVRRSATVVDRVRRSTTVVDLVIRSTSVVDLVPAAYTRRALSVPVCSVAPFTIGLLQMRAILGPIYKQQQHHVFCFSCKQATEVARK